jgi:hypothetical protein
MRRVQRRKRRERRLDINITHQNSVGLGCFIICFSEAVQCLLYFRSVMLRLGSAGFLKGVTKGLACCF